MKHPDRPPSQVSRADAAAQSAQPATFEEGLAQLAELVGKLEGGQLGLAESIAAYERGVTLVRALHGELSDVEQRVRMLTASAPERTMADGEEGDSSPLDDSHPFAGDGLAAPLPGSGDAPGGGSVSPGSGAVDRGAGGRGKGAGGRTSRPAGGRPRRLPGMDEPPAEA